MFKGSVFINRVNGSSLHIFNHLRRKSKKREERQIELSFFLLSKKGDVSLVTPRLLAPTDAICLWVFFMMTRLYGINEKDV